MSPSTLEGAFNAPGLWKATIRIERVTEATPPLGIRARSDVDIAEIARSLIPLDEREHFLVFLLDGRNAVKAYAEVSVGTLNSALVHPRDIYRPALIFGAASVVVAHNHPSGDPMPSTEDLAVTRRLQEVGELVGVPLIDHVIVGDGSHVSLLEHGNLSGIPGNQRGSR